MPLPTVTAVYECEGENWLVHLEEDRTFHSFGRTLDEARSAAFEIAELYADEVLGGAPIQLIHKDA